MKPLHISGDQRVPVIPVIHEMPVHNVLHKMQIIAEIQIIIENLLPELRTESVQIISPLVASPDDRPKMCFLPVCREVRKNGTEIEPVPFFHVVFFTNFLRHRKVNHS